MEGVFFYHKSRIHKPALANKQKGIVGSLRTDEYDKAKQLAYKKGRNLKPSKTWIKC